MVSDLFKIAQPGRGRAKVCCPQPTPHSILLEEVAGEENRPRQDCGSPRTPVPPPKSPHSGKTPNPEKHKEDDTDLPHPQAPEGTMVNGFQKHT